MQLLITLVVTTSTRYKMVSCIKNSKTLLSVAFAWRYWRVLWNVTIVERTIAKLASKNGRKIVLISVLESYESALAHTYSKNSSTYWRSPVKTVENLCYSLWYKNTKNGAVKTNVPINNANQFLSTEAEKNSNLRKQARSKFVMTYATKCSDSNRLWSPWNKRMETKLRDMNLNRWRSFRSGKATNRIGLPRMPARSIICKLFLTSMTSFQSRRNKSKDNWGRNKSSLSGDRGATGRTLKCKTDKVSRKAKWPSKTTKAKSNN